MTIDEFPASLGVTVSQQADIIRRQYLRGNNRVAMNRIDGVLTTAGTVLNVEFTEPLPRAGDVLEIEDELILAWTAGDNCTVQRGFDGTTAVQHPDDSVVSFNERFPRSTVISSMREEVGSWPGSLYAVASGSLTVGARINAIDLAGTQNLRGLRLLGVWRTPQDFQDYTFDRESWPMVARARIEPVQDSIDFPSGWALILPETFDQAYEVRVALGYHFPLDTFATSSDLGSVTGLTRDLLDIIGLGVAARLVGAKEIARIDTTALGRSRRAEEVREGSILRAGTTYWELRSLRIGEAVKKLAAQWGWIEGTW